MSLRDEKDNDSRMLRSDAGGGFLFIPLYACAGLQQESGLPKEGGENTEHWRRSSRRGVLEDIVHDIIYDDRIANVCDIDVISYSKP